ncbi:MAG: TIGR02147 family protein [bacterium]|nr:TIGR02147 family protein [bacterium]
MERPDIVEFDDYRAYLIALFSFCKEQQPHFSHRYIVQKAGYRSPTMLKDVLDGRKNLTPTSAERFAAAFKLSAEERRYFLVLHKFNTAETIAEKDSSFSDLTTLRTSQRHRQIAEEEFTILDNWWTLALREALSLPDYDGSDQWLATVLQPFIATKEVQHSLALLEEAGMIERVDGRWRSCDAVIKTARTVPSLKVVGYHRQMIDLAKRALWEVPAAEREISGTTLRIPREKVDEFKDMLYALRQSMLQIAEESDDADQVYQLNFQLFPLVAVDRDKRGATR